MAALIFTSSVAWTGKSWAQTMIGLVDDGPQPRLLVPIEVLEREIQRMVGGELDMRLPENKGVHGESSRLGIKDALTFLFDGPEVDIIITTGIAASAEAAKFDHLSKPVVASIVVDVSLPGVPMLKTPSAARPISATWHVCY